MNIIELLKARGLFEDMTSPDVVTHTGRPSVIYAGFDPSSDSLQVGNLVTIMGLSHFQRCGHRVIALVGGATGMIGDPSGKSAERALLTPEQVAHNAAGIRENLSRFLDFGHPSAPAILVNNADWFAQFTFIDFLRDVGKHFRMGAMLSKDSVRSRLDSESGMSFTEFSYQLLQGYDFMHLFDHEQCRLQLGGSDQWGNITAGAELVRRLRGEEVFGVTMPLVCDSAGQKFGKSAGNAIYLAAARTSVHDFYQFFVRTEDADVVRFLKIFTFLELDEITAYADEVAAHPERRTAQRRLAEEVTRLVHGVDGLAAAQRSADVLYGAAMEGLHADELLAVFADVPSTELPLAALVGQPLTAVAADGGLCKSRGEARRLIQNGGLYVNNRRVEDVEQCLSAGDVIDDCLVVLRSGKKRYRLVKLVAG